MNDWRAAWERDKYEVGRAMHEGGVIGRFLRMVDFGNAQGCWLWRGARNTEGYGRFAIRRRHLSYAHRFSYELFVGPIPEGMQLDHLCRNPSCVRFDHLEAVTNQENTLRGFAGQHKAAENLAKDSCPFGHPYSGSNLYIRPNGGRGCRECRNEASRQHKARRR